MLVRGQDPLNDRSDFNSPIFTHVLNMLATASTSTTLRRINLEFTAFKHDCATLTPVAVEPAAAGISTGDSILANYTWREMKRLHWSRLGSILLMMANNGLEEIVFRLPWFLTGPYAGRIREAMCENSIQGKLRFITDDINQE